MPVFLATLGGVLLNIAGSFALRVLVSLGISLVTYKGINTSLDWLKSQAISSIQGLNSDILGIIGVLQVGTCISIIFSAMTARLLITGFSSDTVKRWVTK
jgi:hypothetical protein